MKSASIYVLAAGLALLCVVGCAVHSHAAAPPAMIDDHSLSHLVHFETGGTWFRNGDRITIEEIHGTSDKIAVGNLYEIKGTYSLASHEKANLEVEVTSNSREHDPHLKTQSMLVDKGDGHFTLYWYFFSDGNPHLSFYPDRGQSFTSLYFGTDDNVLKHASWLDDAGH